MDAQYLILDTCVISSLLYRNNLDNHKLNRLKEIINGKRYVFSITIFTFFELLKPCRNNFDKKYIQNLVGNLHINKVELYNNSHFQKFKVPEIYEVLYNSDLESFNKILEVLYEDDKKAKSHLISDYFINFAYLCSIIEMYSVFSDKKKLTNKYTLVNWFRTNWREQFGSGCLKRVEEFIDSSWKGSYSKIQIRDESYLIIKEFMGICLYIDDLISTYSSPNTDSLLNDVARSIELSINTTNFNTILNKLSRLKSHFKCKTNSEVLRVLINEHLYFQNDFLKETIIYLFETSPMNAGSIDLNDWVDLMNIYCLEKFSKDSIYITFDKKWVKFLNSRKKNLKYLLKSSHYCNLINRK